MLELSLGKESLQKITKSGINRILETFLENTIAGNKTALFLLATGTQELYMEG